MKKFSRIDEAWSKDDQKRLNAKFATMTHHTAVAKKTYRHPGGDHGGKNDHIYVIHKGKEYSHTGKTGTNIKHNEPSWEYSHDGKDGESRLWMTKSGHVEED